MFRNQENYLTDEQYMSQEQSPRRESCKLPGYIPVPRLVLNRSIGLKQPHGHADRFASTIYHSFESTDRLTNKSPEIDASCGGIFNLEFSLDGRLLVAACEGKQVMLYDTANQKRLKTLQNAHIGCVNCIKFINDYAFATGSDDTLIKLWDVRNLRSCTRTLHGHSSWVKNIEWSEQERVLVSSGFDGTIYQWNINETTENNMPFNKLFHMAGLMRMKLTPDGQKMVICTTMGYMIIIHNLHLPTLHADFDFFKPGLYRIMQINHITFPVGTHYNYLFNPNRKRNRVEFIDDFPNDAEIICSLQIHPHGWCAVSRNLNGEEKTEWTAVHDIQERDIEDYTDAYELIECDGNSSDAESSAESRHQRPLPTDLWLSTRAFVDDDINRWQPAVIDVVHSGLIGSNMNNRSSDSNKIVKNLCRMTHYVSEMNVGKGFIKVLSFSSDGRIIASPYGKGVRLLAFNEQCQEMSDCIANRPQLLKSVVTMQDYHREIVVSCKFSPLQHQLVTGCLGSEIKWYQPVL